MSREAALFAVEDYSGEDGVPSFAGTQTAVQRLSDELKGLPFQYAFSIYNDGPQLNERCTRSSLLEVFDRWKSTPTQTLLLVMCGHGMAREDGAHFVPYGRAADAPGFSTESLIEAAYAVAATGKRLILVLDFCLSGAVVQRLEELARDPTRSDVVGRVAVLASSLRGQTTSPGTTFLDTIGRSLRGGLPSAKGVLLLPSFLTGIQASFDGSPDVGVTWFLGASTKDIVVGVPRSALFTRLALAAAIFVAVMGSIFAATRLLGRPAFATPPAVGDYQCITGGRAMRACVVRDEGDGRALIFHPPSQDPGAEPVFSGVLEPGLDGCVVVSLKRRLRLEGSEPAESSAGALKLCAQPDGRWLGTWKEESDEPFEMVHR